MACWIVDLQPARRMAVESEPIVSVIHSLGHEVIETAYDPAGGVIPLELAEVFDAGKPVILWGSVGFAAWAHNRWPGLRPGAFRTEKINVSHWLPAYGDLALNVSGVITTYADFNQRRRVYESQFGGAMFVKPADGGKLLSGIVLESDQPLFDAHFHRYRRWTTPPDDYRILVAPVQSVRAEWRFVVVQGVVVAASQYKVGDILESQPGAPPEATRVAETVARHLWQPAEAFVADVAQTDEGFNLLELNTFGTSGLYDCDLEAVVTAISRLAE